MVGSVSSALSAAGYSWSITGKDHDGDGRVTRDEFKLPVAPGTLTAVPADLQAAGSLDDAFDSYDHNHDGIIDQSEAKSGATSRQTSRDLFSANWSVGMTTEQALGYFNVVNADNAALAKQWGLKT